VSREAASVYKYFPVKTILPPKSINQLEKKTKTYAPKNIQSKGQAIDDFASSSGVR
jgi:hypothetical protein